jgi:hypothetical protein
VAVMLHSFEARDEGNRHFGPGSEARMSLEFSQRLRLTKHSGRGSVTSGVFAVPKRLDKSMRGLV